MEDKARRPEILIVYGYHPKEIFAVEIGEYLLRNSLNPDIKIVKYGGRSDSGNSTYYLRRFIEKFDPVISPLILHGDDDIGIDAIIIYSAKMKQEKRDALKPLLNFCFERTKGNSVVTCGRFLVQNTKYSLIEIELNSRVGLQRAAELVLDFSRYLINLYLEKEIRL